MTAGTLPVSKGRPGFESHGAFAKAGAAARPAAGDDTPAAAGHPAAAALQPGADAFVEAELERNPLLERDESGEPRPAASREPAELAKPMSRLAAADEGWLDLGKPVADAPRPPRRRLRERLSRTRAGRPGDQIWLGGWASLRQRRPPARTTTSTSRRSSPAKLSLRDHLSEQLPLVVDRARRAADRPVPDRYGRRGGLSAGRPARTAGREARGAAPSWSSACSASLQTLDPPGVFARNLAECLALQLKEQNRYDPVNRRACSTTSHLLADHNLPRCARARSEWRWTS